MFSNKALEAIAKIKAGFDELAKLDENEGVVFLIEGPSDDGDGLYFTSLVISDGYTPEDRITVISDGECIYPAEGEADKIHEMTKK